MSEKVSHGVECDDLEVDFAAQHAAKVAALNAQADDWNAPAEKSSSPARQQNAASQKEKNTPLFQLLSSTEAAAEKPMRWKIKGLMPYHGIGEVSGASMAAKTFLMLSLVEALADGAADWYGYRIPEACPVVYVSLEGDAGFRVRVRAMQHYRRQEGRKPLPDALQFVIGQEFHIMDKKHVEELASVCPKGALIVIDTLNASAPDVDENSSKDMGRVVDGMKKLAAAVQGFVLMVAHEGLNTPGRARGSSVQLPAMDLHISVEKQGRRREWRAIKVKDGVESAGGNPFRLALMDMGEDVDGDRITSCVAVPDDDPMPEIEKPVRPSSYGKELLTAFELAAQETGEATLHRDVLRDYFYRKTTAEGDNKRQAFGRALKDLVAKNIVTVDADFYTRTETEAGQRDSVTPPLKRGECHGNLSRSKSVTMSRSCHGNVTVSRKDESSLAREGKAY